MADVDQAIEEEYTVGGLGDRILTALEEAGINLEALTPEILAPMDQIHGGGLQSTIQHAAMLALNSEMKVLDVGCGIGGPARYLAQAFGCRVAGIDLTGEYISVAEMLTQRCGLEQLASFKCASALEMPYEDGSFDLVFCQNVTMNIQDRAGFYRELRRVLKSGGKITVSELGQGAGGEPYYPLPWASKPSHSFLVPPEEMRAALEAAGFRITAWVDETEGQKKAGGNKPGSKAQLEGALNIQVTRGEDYPARRANTAKSIAENRLTNITLVAERV